MLASCDAVILMNAHPAQTGGGRDDRAALLAMRDAARPILEAVERHGSLHLILIGTLRVHPQATPEEPITPVRRHWHLGILRPRGNFGLKNGGLNTQLKIHRLAFYDVRMYKVSV